MAADPDPPHEMGTSSDFRGLFSLFFLSPVFSLGGKSFFAAFLSFSFSTTKPGPLPLYLGKGPNTISPVALIFQHFFSFGRTFPRIRGQWSLFNERPLSNGLLNNWQVPPAWPPPPPPLKIIAPPLALISLLLPDEIFLPRQAEERQAVGKVSTPETSFLSFPGGTPLFLAGFHGILSPSPSA